MPGNLDGKFFAIENIRKKIPSQINCSLQCVWYSCILVADMSCLLGQRFMWQSIGCSFVTEPGTLLLLRVHLLTVPFLVCKLLGAPSTVHLHTGFFWVPMREVLHWVHVQHQTLLQPHSYNHIATTT